ncbi:hypothetical protein E3P92_02425 [Wallemia ichthyophaga]|uniref:Translin n=2 Tax=Wallemia ichthyophaga TaxID=245174 RepID=A0A4T0I3N4_WALIC|nr:Translin [Wallemia ichthyophaga EXF-994]TIA81170.1 hypothetical protein E3P98_02242 [Wallemia ichthyophaga]EOQ99356.1 Translin [Wallemia ichthyophaga EXF-994]TIA90605.1 hypothetical protein E3P97_02438 [Wallemia ichthyophaga]TIA99382.1 hypothetical protein E3P95_02080 [Wallemia ichthyophaga]TIB00381.1 hypothetical protein E3P94_02204 [Wallemia ichthyophaga]
MSNPTKRLHSDSFKEQLKDLNGFIEKDNEYKQSLKDRVAVMDESLHESTAIAQNIHSIKQSEIPQSIIKPMESGLLQYAKDFHQLCSEIEPTDYTKYEHIWNRSLQTFIYLNLLSNYLSHDDIIDYSTIKLMINNDNHLYDYLFALMQLVSELTRLTVNTVILNEFDRPKRISAFIKDVYQALSQLNFKNDALRRKFDALKYDINKVEGVIYDLTLRNLN